MGSERSDRECHLPGAICDGNEPAVAERPGQISGLRFTHSDGSLGRTARDCRRSSLSGFGRGGVCHRQLVVCGWWLDGAITTHALLILPTVPLLAPKSCIAVRGIPNP